MPTINRIRIVNYAYNDDNRLIIDETFEYHGKNAMMHLLNGGGKTVLIQAIMQPFIPLAKLGKREFEELFRKDKEPSYILIEWRLDNNNGFMTNGIAIRRNSNSSQDDEDSDKFDYFTFIIESARSNVNITNLKLSNKADDRITFMGYHELKNFINKNGGNTYEKLSDAYKRALNSFRIDTKEWKNVIAKINSEEGGLLKLFDKCNTSVDLMRDWILKSIKENLSDVTNLPNLLEQTEKHILNSRQKIEDKKKREDLSKYTEDLNEINIKINELKKINEKTDKSKTELSNLVFSLKTYISRKEQEIENIGLDIESINKRLDEIKVEELSKEYYQLEDTKIRFEEEKQEVNIMLDDLKYELKKCERLEKSLKAAYLTKECLEKELELEDVTAKLSKLSQEQSEIDKQVENLGFTIKNLYEEKIIDMDNQIKNNKEILNVNSKELNGLRSHNDRVSKEYLELEKNISSINTEINTISNRIKNLVNEIDSLNIFLSIDKDEVIKKKNEINANINYATIEIKSLNSENCNIKEKIKNNSESIVKLAQEITHIENEIKTSIKELDKYHEELADVAAKLCLHGIENFSSAQKEDTINIINDKITNLSNSVEINNIGVTKNKDILEKLSSGGIKINKDFVNYLKDKGIVYILGSDYIKNSIPTEELRNRIINTNSLLPFAVILDHKSIEYIQKDTPKIYSDSPIVIIQREALNDINITNISGYAEITRNIGILSLYNKELVVKMDVEQEKHKIETEIARLQEEARNWGNQIRDLILLKGKIENFSYSEDYEKTTSKLIRGLTEAADNKQKLSLDTKENSIELEKEQENKEKKIKNNEQCIRELKEQINKCDELADLILKKDKFNKELNDLNGQSKDSKKEKDELTSRIGRLNQNEMEMRESNSKLEEKVNHIKNSQQKYLHYATGNLLKGQLELLEQKYESLRSKADIDLLDDYRKKESNLKNKIKDLKNNLSVYTDYDIVEYSFNLEYEIDIRIKKLYKDIDPCESRVAVLNNNINNHEKSMNDIIEKLKPNVLKERYDIGDNLSAKKIELVNRLNMANNFIKNIRIDIDESSKVLNRIKDSGHLLGYEKSLPDEFNENYIANKVKVFEDNNSELLNLKIVEDKIKNSVKGKVETLWINHSKKNATIDNSINCLRQVVVSNISLDLYVIIERQMSIIDRLLDKIQTDLEVLENEEKYIIERFLDVTKQYTEEINKIDKNSYITVQGQRLKMIRIKNIKNDESSPVNLSIFVRRQIENLTNNLQLTDTDLIKAINREFNTENLLNNYCNLDHVRINFLKIEENIILSKERSWEEVTTNNSGGEKFVSYFVLFSTLINYERKNHLNKETVSMCLIMDNPFAAISSKHLLIPLFEYAKKTNIQLICFTDHNKADILDRFDVIHKLVVKTLKNSKEFISSEKIKDNFEELSDGYYYYNEQISFV